MCVCVQALLAAVEHEAYQAAEVLLQLGADATEALLLAVETHRLWFLEAFHAMVCHQSHTPACKRMLERMDWAACAVAKGHTPLTLAIFFERYDAMRLLLCDGRLPARFIDEPVHSLSSSFSAIQLLHQQQEREEEEDEPTLPPLPSPAGGGTGTGKRKCTAMHIALLRRNADAILLLGAARAIATDDSGGARATKRRRRTSSSTTTTPMLH